MSTPFENPELNKFSPEIDTSHQDIVSDDEIWTLLSIYSDGEATPAEAARVEALFEAGPTMGNELKFLQSTAETVRTFTEVDPPISLRESIFASTIHRETNFQRMQAWLSTQFAPAPLRYSLAGGALLASVLVVGFWTNKPNHYKQEPHNDYSFSTPRRVILPPYPNPGTSIREDKHPDKVVAQIDSQKKLGSKLTGISGEKNLTAQDINRFIAASLHNSDRAVKPVRTASISPWKHTVDKAVQEPDTNLKVAANPNVRPKINQDDTTHLKVTDNNKVDSSELGNDIDTTTHDEKVVSNTMPTTNVEPSNHSNVRLASLNLAARIPSTPPDSLAYRANAEIRRNLELEHSGYDDRALKNIERHQIAYSSTLGRF